MSFLAEVLLLFVADPMKGNLDCSRMWQASVSFGKGGNWLFEFWAEKQALLLKSCCNWLSDTDDTINIVSISWDLLVSVSVSVSIFHIPESQSQYRYRFFTSLGLSLSLNIDFSNCKVSIWVSVEISLSYVVKVSVSVSVSWDFLVSVSVSVSKIATFKSQSQYCIENCFLQISVSVSIWK